MYIHIKIIKENTWPGIMSTMDRPSGWYKSKNFTKQQLEVLVDSVYEHKAILTAILTSRFNMRM